MAFMILNPLYRKSLSVLSPKLPSLRCHASSALPRILEPELWKTVTPRFLRRSESPTSHANGRFGWVYFFQNPATHIALFAVLCGSQAIHVITLRNHMADQDSLVQRKVELLNEVIEKIKAGDAVDVKELLGTGDTEKEKEWADVIDELGDASKWLSKAKPRRKQQSSPENTSENKMSFYLRSLSFFKSSSSEVQTASQRQSLQPGSTDISRKPSFI